MISRKAVVLDSPVRLSARTHRSRSPWEVGIRYAAAYACTLISVGAAQLVVRDGTVWLLALLTLLGLPISLMLRSARNDGRLQFKGRPIPRPFINGGVMLATVLVCAAIMGPSIPAEVDRLFDISFATQTVKLLMQAFLIFGVCRCLAILNDKDAVLCTVPSFSVLLLLIVIHKGPEVVAFFALWAVASAVLIALDFRSDTRSTCSAMVPGLVPNQELKLSGRALATVLGFSLSAAGVLSYNLAENDTSAADEGWISNLASRLNGFALDLPDTSGNGGPERQIDFASLPSTPLRTKLWSVKTQRTDTWKVVRPRYWRMFTLSQYDGHSWSQAGGPGQSIQIVPLGPDRWAVDPAFNTFRRRAFGIGGGRYSGAPASVPGRFPNGPFSRPRLVYDVETFGPKQSRAPYFGATPATTSPRPIATATPVPTASASTSNATLASAEEDEGSDKPQGEPVRLYQVIRATTSNTGFLPIQPGTSALRFDYQGTQPISVRERGDASLDVGVMVRGTGAMVQSSVAPLEVFGLEQREPPLKRIKNPRLTLSPNEAKRYIELPGDLPKRVVQWAKQRTRNSPPDASNYRRALRLSAALQEGAFYTLRPPLVPAERDATDFFLFDSRRGYCTHFAGSLAATCRAVGIPARVVSGFTNAEWPDEFPGVAELRESGSHAWVEIWEPGWGWALVDPTPPDSRGNNAPSLLQSWEDVRGIVGEFLAKHFARLPLAPVMLGAALLIIALGAARRARHRPEVGPKAASVEDARAREEITRFFARASRRMTRKFRARAPWETPSEWLLAAHESLNLRDEAPLRELFELFVLARFSPHALNATHAQQAREAWARLSWAKNPREKKVKPSKSPQVLEPGA